MKTKKSKLQSILRSAFRGVETGAILADGDGTLDPNFIKAAHRRALDECRAELAEQFYQLALAIFARSEGRSQNVYVRGIIITEKEILPKIERAAAIVRSFSDRSEDLHQIIAESRSLANVENLCRRSRRWCELAVALSGGQHMGAMDLLAAQLLLEKKPAAALVVYDRIATTTKSLEQRAFALSNCGKALLELNCVAAAARACERSIEIQPTDGVANANLAIAKLLLSEPEAALDAYERIANSVRDDAPIANKLSRLLDGDLRWARANRAITAGLEKKIRKDLQVLGLVSRKRSALTLSRPART